MKYALSIAALLVTALLAAGCEPDGPFEEAGEEVDEGIDNIEESVEDAADEVEDTADRGA